MGTHPRPRSKSSNALAGQPCDITGIADYKHLDDCGGIQWPLSKGLQRCKLKVQNGRVCLRRTCNLQPSTFNRTKSVACSRTVAFSPRRQSEVPVRPAAPRRQPTDEEFPFVMLYRSWHECAMAQTSNTRTGKSAVLRTALSGECLRRDSSVRSGPPRSGGKQTCRRAVPPRTDRMCRRRFAERAARTSFIPMHYDVTNKLTRTEYDPHSRQPSYKYCAVRHERKKFHDEHSIHSRNPLRSTPNNARGSMNGFPAIAAWSSRKIAPVHGALAMKAQRRAFPAESGRTVHSSSSARRLAARKGSPKRAKGPIDQLRLHAGSWRR